MHFARADHKQQERNYRQQQQWRVRSMYVIAMAAVIMQTNEKL